MREDRKNPLKTAQEAVAARQFDKAQALIDEQQRKQKERRRLEAETTRRLREAERRTLENVAAMRLHDTLVKRRYAVMHGQRRGEWAGWDIHVSFDLPRRKPSNVRRSVA